MTSLTDTVLPVIRTRADLCRWGAANAHGSDMDRAIDVLESALPSIDPTEFYTVVHAALASSRASPTPMRRSATDPGQELVGWSEHRIAS